MSSVEMPSSSKSSTAPQTDNNGEGKFEEWLDGKIFNDPIHETIRLHPVSVAIAGTPQFQRLMNIKQLGAGYYVYPGASHNRYEHSIGVAYLAGQFARKLRENQPELNITPKDVLCAEIAGLCHDMGHGPFSHLFDNMFIPAIKEMKGSTDPPWKHEDASLKIVDDIVDNNQKVNAATEEYHLDQTDITFIKEMITGQSLEEGMFQGRGREKWFLYQIVANKKNGIDVDKWDYFARDSYMLGMKDNFSHKRYMEMARVIDVKGEKHICMRDKEVINLYDMYHTREALHRRAYQHTVTKGIELMIVDALVKADEHFSIPPEKKVKLSDSIGNMQAYSKLDDSILTLISLTPGPEDETEEDKLKPSKDLIERIRSRQLYKCVAKLPFEMEENKEHLQQQIVSPTDGISSEDFAIFKMKIDYGAKDKDPIKSVYFYRKGDLNTAIELQADEIPKMRPAVFEEKHWVVYSKNPSTPVDLKLKKRLQTLKTQWEKKKSLETERKNDQTLETV